MAVRSITVDGVAWTVWDVVPERGHLPDKPSLRQELESGWLCMENSAGEKRRLVPRPPGWEAWDDQRLALGVRSAPPVRRREGAGAG